MSYAKAFPLNYISDNFINSCHYLPKYITVTRIVTPFYTCTDPFFLVCCSLIILIFLPIIFLNRTTYSFMKISKLYNISRLTILTFFHRLCYVYLIFVPLSFLIDQAPPCLIARSNENNFKKLQYFPQPKFASIVTLFLYFSEFFPFKRAIIAYMIIFLSSIHYIISGDLSIAQSMFTMGLVYILHYYAQRVPFFVMHIENGIFLISITLIAIFKNTEIRNNKYVNGRIITAYTMMLCDTFGLVRYHFTRYHYISVGKAIDIQLETDGKSRSYLNVISSEGEDIFHKNLVGDLIDSIMSMIIFIIGLFVRSSSVEVIKSSHSGYI